MLSEEKKKLSCSNCRKIKRKCDGGHPCSSCTKRNVTCDYNTTDRRSQRYSVGYIKSLETNNDVLEDALAGLVAIRDDPDALAAKLESLSLSFPKRVERPVDTPGDLNMDDEYEPSENEIADKPYITDSDQYFGAGSVYHVRGVPTQAQEPLLATSPLDLGPIDGVITLEQDFEYVTGLVRDYFTYQYYGTQHILLDKNRILYELENRNLSGPFLNAELIYAICANSGKLTFKEADAYCDYVLKGLFLERITLSIAISQCYTLLALHCISKGQISKAWLFAGIGIRIGLDVGFDMSHGENSCPTSNRCFMGTLVMDQYFAMSLGRRSCLQQNSVPILRLNGESEVDYLNVKYSIELIEMTRHMVRLTYQPVTFDKDPKINYLLKFNRLKVFNMKLLKWRQNLDPACSWLYASLKSAKDLAIQNHTLKFLYYYLLIFLNKPFLHVPKQHSTVFLIEEMAKEVYLIVYQKLVKIDEENGTKLHGRDVNSAGPHTRSIKYSSASMDICVVMLLANVLLTLITSQPEHYIHLEKQFKAFAQYTNYIGLRKYDAVEKPMTVLLRKFEDFKAQMKSEGSQTDGGCSDQEQIQIGEEGGSTIKSSPPTSANSDNGKVDCDLAGKLKLDGVPNWNTFPQNTTMPVDLLTYLISSPEEGQDASEFDPWWQQLNNNAMISHNESITNGQPLLGQQGVIAANQNESNFMPGPPFQIGQTYGEEFLRYQNPQIASQLQPDFLTGQPHLKQEPVGTGPVFGQQEIYSYDHLPKSKDPVDQILNLLFSNTGNEFDVDKTRFDWDGMFREQYPSMPQ